jgi:hypothetical protein
MKERLASMEDRATRMMLLKYTLPSCGCLQAVRGQSETVELAPDWTDLKGWGKRAGCRRRDG